MSESRQPREITLPYEFYKAGLHAEQQKFRNWSKEKQLTLLDDPNLEEEELANQVEITGLDLTVSEDKALAAIQILLDKTDYAGNLPAMEIYSSDFEGRYRIPRLSFTYSEYFEAYGLRKIEGRYQGRGVQEALDALRSMEKPRRVCYQRKKWVDAGKGRREAKYDLVVANKPLVNILRGYRDLSKRDAQRIMGGEDIPERANLLIVEPSPLLLDQVESFYVLKPVLLHEEVKGALGGKRAARCISLFIEWLMTLDQAVVKIDKMKLAGRLRMDGYIKNRRRSELNKRLEEAFAVAKGLNYLLDYEENYGMVVLRLNPERCRRVKRVLAAKGLPERSVEGS